MSARSLDDDDDDDAEDDAIRRRKWTETCGRDTLTSSGISTHFRLPATPPACIVVLSFLFRYIYYTVVLSALFLHWDRRLSGEFGRNIREFSFSKQLKDFNKLTKILILLLVTWNIILIRIP